MVCTRCRTRATGFCSFICPFLKKNPKGGSFANDLNWANNSPLELNLHKYKLIHSATPGSWGTPPHRWLWEVCPGSWGPAERGDYDSRHVAKLARYKEPSTLGMLTCLTLYFFPSLPLWWRKKIFWAWEIKFLDSTVLVNRGVISQKLSDWQKEDWSCSLSSAAFLQLSIITIQQNYSAKSVFSAISLLKMAQDIAQLIHLASVIYLSFFLFLI